MEDKIDQVNILGVKVDNLNIDQVVNLVGDWLKSGGKHYIVTPNPEFIVAAQKDEEFRKVLNNADLAIPDGTRLGWASRVIKEKNFFKKVLLFPLFIFPAEPLIQFNTVAGVDLMEALCKEAAEKGFTTGFLGGQNSVAKKSADCLQKKYPKLKVVFTDDGPEVDSLGNVLSIMYYGEKEQNQETLIHNTCPIPQLDLLFVAFGQVKQEKWIVKNLEKIPVKVAMGVGGAFDEISGNVPRVPQWVYKLGFKWLFRLIIQPWRIKRQLQLLKFIFLVSTRS